MLVLTRKAGAGDQSVIRIGDDIEVTVIEVRGDQVRIGIAAPRETVIDRTEIWQQKKEQKHDAKRLPAQSG